VKILSGVFEGKTTGAPIALLIQNTDQRSQTTPGSWTGSAPAMPITLPAENTACATTAVADVRARARPRCVWQPVPLQEVAEAAIRHADPWLPGATWADCARTQGLGRGRAERFLLARPGEDSRAGKVHG